jgi:6-phosphogluconolactonase/glucosamine-6-phosphate isomerase/deaminase
MLAAAQRQRAVVLGVPGGTLKNKKYSVLAKNTPRLTT